MPQTLSPQPQPSKRKDNRNMTAHTHHHRRELMALDWNKAGKYKVQYGVLAGAEGWVTPGEGCSAGSKSNTGPTNEVTPK